MTTRSLLLALAFPALLAAAPAPSSPATVHVLRHPDVAAPSAAGCDVTFVGRNGGGEAIYVDFFQSQVRRRIGTWKSLDPHQIPGEPEYTDYELLDAGERYSWPFGLDGGCNARRRYRFKLVSRESGASYTHYYPSSDRWTQETVIDLGDVSRFFTGEASAASDPSRDGPDRSSGPGCSVTFQGLNGSDDNTYTVAWWRSRVRPRGGGPLGERRLAVPPQRRVLEPGDSFSKSFGLTFGCDTRRRYDIHVRREREGLLTADDTHVITFPSEDGWTTQTAINLGDVSRFFAGERAADTDVPADTGAPAHAPDRPDTQDPSEPPPAEDGPPPAGGGAEAPPPSGFAPSGRILLEEDFGGVAEGDFPQTLEYLDGQMEVAAFDGRPALRLTDKGWFRVPLPEDLPERFTVEFGFHNPNRQTALYLAPFDAATANRPPDYPNYRYGPHHYVVLSQESLGVGVTRNDQPPRSIGQNAAFVSGLVPVRVQVDGAQAKVFVDGEQVASLPRADFARSDQLEFFYGGFGGPAYLTDLRVAGGPTGGSDGG